VGGGTTAPVLRPHSGCCLGSRAVLGSVSSSLLSATSAPRTNPRRSASTEDEPPSHAALRRRSQHVRRGRACAVAQIRAPGGTARAVTIRCWFHEAGATTPARPAGIRTSALSPPRSEAVAPSRWLLGRQWSSELSAPRTSALTRSLAARLRARGPTRARIPR
jgi:hypothetical protein